MSGKMKDGEQKAQCHWVSNTHWDREWRYSMQRVRYMLVAYLDMLFDIFEKEPAYRSFHLDSQTVPIRDYLEIRPEMEATVRRYVKQKRLFIGPWFCLPDEFCVGGESLIRNLLLGHRIAREYGPVSKTGYSPFGWGQISQMPQIYRGFGIEMSAFYRGVNTIAAPRSEFLWEGPDGTNIVGSRLAKRPRYNAWYVITRPLLWNVADENGRDVAWSDGHGPFRFIDTEYADLDCRYVHPKYAYHRHQVAARAAQAFDEQDGDWTTPHRFWSNGHDSSCPDIREARMIRDCREAIKDKADVFHSTVAAFQEGVLKSVDPGKLNRINGEMRYFYTEGSTAPLFGWISSARMDIKQDNFRTERALTTYAEPLSVFGAMLGAPYPRGFVDAAYDRLLQNHGHDSIGGCSRDIVHDDMLFRSRQVREISSCLIETAMMNIAGSIDLSDREPSDVALVVYNPAPFKRSEVMTAVIETPCEWKSPAFDIVDAEGKRVATQQLAGKDTQHTVVQCPTDCANILSGTRHTVAAKFDDVPGMGYRTCFLKQIKTPRAETGSLLKSRRVMENEYLSVRVNPNGTLDITDRRTKRVMKGQGYFRDSSAIGNPWERARVEREQTFDTKKEKAAISVKTSGPLETSFEVVLNWKLPAGRSKDEKRRAARMVPCRIVNTVTLRKGEPWVAIETTVENRSEDHYLQVSFPTGIETETVHARTPFDVVERNIQLPDRRLYAERLQTEQPMDSFVDIFDGSHGVAFLNEGMKAYEAHDDRPRTVSLTLLRSFPLRICITQGKMTDYSHLDKGSQCLGTHTFRYAVMPHRGDWLTAGIWKAAERFTAGFRAVQVGPTAHGTEKLEKSFLELKKDGLHVSGIKRSEDGKGWIVRLFNPADRTVRDAVRLNGGRSGPKPASPVRRRRNDESLPGKKGRAWKKVQVTNLEEIPERTVKIGKNGWVSIRAGRRKIVTLKFE